MIRIVSTAAVALAISVLPVLAQTNQSKNPNVTVPSAQNSGAGIQGMPGNKNGPAARSGTVGSSARQHDATIKEQDPAKIKGMRGNKDGPPAKPSSK